MLTKVMKSHFILRLNQVILMMVTFHLRKSHFAQILFEQNGLRKPSLRKIWLRKPYLLKTLFEQKYMTLAILRKMKCNKYLKKIKYFVQHQYSFCSFISLKERLNPSIY